MELIEPTFMVLNYKLTNIFTPLCSGYCKYSNHLETLGCLE